MITGRVRYLLVASVAFSLGIVSASLSPGGMEEGGRLPLVEPLQATCRGQPLRPLNVRTGDAVRRLHNDGAERDGDLLYVFLDVDGVPVTVTFDPPPR